jgi:NAD(P)H-flavin reductase
MAAPQKIRAYIKKIKKYEDDVTLFELCPEKKCKFRPGQFLHLAMDKYDPSDNWPESRVFSIANSPLQKEYIEILVSPKGIFTKKMVTQLKENDDVWLKLPYGSFNFTDVINSDCILIAGGTGISPFISFLNYAVDTELNYNSVKLYYGVRSRGLIIYEELLEKCLKFLKNFDFKIYIENFNYDNSDRISNGILPVSKIIDTAEKLKNPVYYLSGPQKMIMAFESECRSRDINKNKILYDKWE